MLDFVIHGASQRRGQRYSCCNAHRACRRFVAGAAIATAPMALVRGHFSYYLGNADDYNFTAVVARR